MTTATPRVRGGRGAELEAVRTAGTCCSASQAVLAIGNKCSWRGAMRLDNPSDELLPGRLFIHARLNDPMTGCSLYGRILAYDGALVEYEQIYRRADGSERLGNLGDYRSGASSRAPSAAGTSGAGRPRPATGASPSGSAGIVGPKEDRGPARWVLAVCAANAPRGSATVPHLLRPPRVLHTDVEGGW
jgi:hypothetical protein